NGLLAFGLDMATSGEPLHAELIHSRRYAKVARTREPRAPQCTLKIVRFSGIGARAREMMARVPQNVVVPSPNIWHWPEVYELENRAQDVGGAIWQALRAEVDWTGRDVVDVGC